jgi:membrane-associated protein
MSGVIDAIQSLPPLVAYAIIGALVFGEAAVFIGFVLPGETSVLLGGFIASTHRLNIAALCALVFVAAVVGDTVGYAVGKHFGPHLVRTRFFKGHAGRLEKARGLLRDRGGPAVLLGRFTAFLRAVMPGLAGLSEMRYHTFLAWNAVGGFLWGVGFCLVGYFAGASYQNVAQQIGRGSAIVIAAIVVLVVVVWQVRRRGRARADDREWERSHGDAEAEDVGHIG